VKPEIIQTILAARGECLRLWSTTPNEITLGGDEYAALRRLKQPEAWGVYPPTRPGGRWMALGMAVYVSHETTETRCSRSD
jgi:hypothetical protein